MGVGRYVGVGGLLLTEQTWEKVTKKRKLEVTRGLCEGGAEAV